MIKHKFDIQSSQVSHDIVELDDWTLPCVDLYTAGPPCQPFFLVGEIGGLLDTRCVVFLRVLQLICHTQPKMFILENARGLKTRHTSTYKFIIDTLQHNKDITGYTQYKVRTRGLNSYYIGGVPQNRPRVYIVGWARAEEVQEFAWPGPIIPTP